ncbi:hypothetical protein M2280_006008 [Prescottella agglutinans]|uniref:Uncharacterized protein n=1 Tax=Prescottella agglutinans TaxID=1644129 RepID=A0ABT6MK93_9NOCA|nr:hypothetical protein [Prescottella agglutinans]
MRWPGLPDRIAVANDADVKHFDPERAACSSSQPDEYGAGRSAPDDVSVGEAVDLGTTIYLHGREALRGVPATARPLTGPLAAQRSHSETPAVDDRSEQASRCPSTATRVSAARPVCLRGDGGDT